MLNDDLFLINREYLIRQFGKADPIVMLRVSGKNNLGYMHHHNFSELSIVLAGKGVYRDQMREYQLTPGDVFFTLPGMMHHYKQQSNLTVVNIIWFDDELNLPLFDLENTSSYQSLFCLLPGGMEKVIPGVVHLDGEQLQQVENILLKLDDELSSGKTGKLLMASCFLQMLKTFICRCMESSKLNTDRKTQQLSKVLLYINSHYSQQISRNQLAKIATMSESSFYRLFCRCIGQPPYAYLTGVRLRHAEDMLRTTDCDMEEIALNCGFCDGNYFVRLFRSHYGITPLAYRKKSSQLDAPNFLR